MTPQTSPSSPIRRLERWASPWTKPLRRPSGIALRISARAAQRSASAGLAVAKPASSALTRSSRTAEPTSARFASLRRMAMVAPKLAAKRSRSRPDSRASRSSPKRWCGRRTFREKRAAESPEDRAADRRQHARVIAMDVQTVADAGPMANELRQRAVAEIHGRTPQSVPEHAGAFGRQVRNAIAQPIEGKGRLRHHMPVSWARAAGVAAARLL